MKIIQHKKQRFIDTYNELSMQHQNLILKHLKLSGELTKWFDLRIYHLLNEFHEKKNISIIDSRIGFTKDVEKYYKKWVFHGKSCMSSFDTFPSAFRSELEEVLFNESELIGYDNSFDRTDVYYSRVLKPKHLTFSEFDKNEWSLDKSIHMTKHDLHIMEKYKTEFITFLNECVRIMKENNRDKDKTCEKEKNRIIRMMQ